jgi:uncharacterized Fe-S center protein
VSKTFEECLGCIGCLGCLEHGVCYLCKKSWNAAQKAMLDEVIEHINGFVTDEVDKIVCHTLVRQLKQKYGVE